MKNQSGQLHSQLWLPTYQIQRSGAGTWLVLLVVPVAIRPVISTIPVRMPVEARLSVLGHKAFSSNLISHPSGMSYGPEGFIFVMRTGKGGTLNPVMPWVAFQNMNDDDLKAIYAYLRTIPASQHYVSNQAPFTPCAICGQKHGLGEKNKREKPAGIKLNPVVYDRYAGHYWNEELNATLIIVREGNRLTGKAEEDGPKIELVPQSETHFPAPGWCLPVSFVQDKNEQVTHLAEDSDEGLMYKKVK